MLVTSFVQLGSTALNANIYTKILVKGPNVSMGYLNNDKATKETYEADGYLHSGDLGSINSDGLITIQDRIKELVKVPIILHLAAHIY